MQAFRYCRKKFLVPYLNFVYCIKGTLWRRLTYIFSPSIKSLIYHIFTYKVWTLNFYSKGSEIWSFILMLGNPNSAGRSYRPLGGDFVSLHCQLGVAACTNTYHNSPGKSFFSFSNGFWTVRTAICYNIRMVFVTPPKIYCGEKIVKKLEIPRSD